MISVVIPSYNRAKTIRMAVDSVLNQTYRDIELIIIDDASTDETGDIITRITDERIRYLRLEQRSGACNGVLINWKSNTDLWLIKIWISLFVV